MMNKISHTLTIHYAQRGVALIGVLFLLLISSGLGVMMVHSSQLSLKIAMSHQTEQLLNLNNDSMLFSLQQSSVSLTPYLAQQFHQHAMGEIVYCYQAKRRGMKAQEWGSLGEGHCQSGDFSTARSAMIGQLHIYPSFTHQVSPQKLTLKAVAISLLPHLGNATQVELNQCFSFTAQFDKTEHIAECLARHAVPYTIHIVTYQLDHQNSQEPQLTALNWYEYYF